MAERAPASLAVPASYADLRRSVETVLVHGQHAIEEAKVRTYWETGRVIGAHLARHAEQPNYGTQAMARLARDLKISDTVLYRCLRFAENFPILARGPKLSWAHYRMLIPVADAAQRRALEREAIRKKWTAAELDERIRPLRAVANGNASNGTTPAPDTVRLLTARRGTPGLHPVVDRRGRLAVDLGFKIYRRLRSAGFATGEIVRVADDGSIRKVPDATKAELFTYEATIARVIDGDTLLIELEIAPEEWREEKLRLRGLDCPELNTAEGKAAKRFTESHLAVGARVTVSTTKPDKYDRYLADVFVRADSGQAIFLNNALLEAGHAEPKQEWEFGDWGN